MLKDSKINVLLRFAEQVRSSLGKTNDAENMISSKAEELGIDLTEIDLDPQQNTAKPFLPK